MEKLKKLNERLIDILENDWAEQVMRKPSLSTEDIKMLNALTDTIKNIQKICLLKSGGYSEDDGPDGYGMGASYGNRGQHYVRPHYSRDDGRNGDGGQGNYGTRRNGGRGGYSRDDGRSEMMEHLEMALDSANEQDREAIRRMMKNMENL